MPRTAAKRPRAARLIEDAVPDLAPLQGLLALGQLALVEWIAAWRLTDGTRIDGYVQPTTGRVLHVGSDGCAYRRRPSGLWSPWDLEDAAWGFRLRRWEWLELGGFPDDEAPWRWPEDDPFTWGYDGESDSWPDGLLDLPEAHLA